MDFSLNMVMYLTQMCSHTHTHTNRYKVFIAALFITAPNWKTIRTILKIFCTLHLFGVAYKDSAVLRVNLLIQFHDCPIF